jgi:hypothetical protein
LVSSPIEGPRPNCYCCHIYVFDDNGAPSLTIGWVCRLQLLLTLANTAILRTEFRETQMYFTALDSRIPQPVGPGPQICIPQEHGGPDIPQGTRFPCYHLLQLLDLVFELHCGRWSVGQFVLVSGPLWGLWPDFNFLCLTITFLLFHVGRPLWREDTQCNN